MKKALGHLHAALQAAGEGLHNIPGPLAQPDPIENAIDALPERLAGHSIEMALVNEIFLDG